MGIKCGIVGLPNVGKSTLFNALTKAGIDAENFPFCTMNRMQALCRCPIPGKTLLRDSLNLSALFPQHGIR